MKQTIAGLVHKLYWKDDINCARTTLTCLSQYFNLPLEKQCLQSAIGMHGAGGFRAQCGLVEGSLMFLGIFCSAHGKTDSEITSVCYQFAENFSTHFSSLRCCELRPNGFTENDPPHACENLTVRGIQFACDFIERLQTTFQAG